MSRTHIDDEPLDDEGPSQADLDELDDDSIDVAPCPACGADIYADAERCPHCGRYVTPGRGAVRWPWWVAAAALAAAALAWVVIRR